VCAGQGFVYCILNIVHIKTHSRSAVPAENFFVRKHGLHASWFAANL